MKAHRTVLSTNNGISTVELVIILAALVSVAVMFRGSLDGFSHRTAAAEFNKKKSVEIMTFGGKVKEARSRSGTLGEIPDKSSGLRERITRTLTGPIRNLFPAGRSEPLRIKIGSDASSRSPASLNAVLDQFEVETAKRYQPTLFKTYCNIFAWDATRAMNAEIPHWINRKTQASYTYNPKLSYAENTEIAYEVNVNALYNWMETNADSIRYRQATEQEAKEAANSGKPAVAIWKSPKDRSSGHIVMLRPYDANRNGDSGQIYIAQAGRQTCNYIPLAEIFSPSMRNALKFYIHE